jgi:SAM-dependent methyltransferase
MRRPTYIFQRLMNDNLNPRRDPMNLREYEIMYRIEDRYWWYVGIRKIARTILDRYVPREGSRRVLDAGCGTGGNLGLLSRYGGVYGVELSREAVRFLKSRGFTRFSTASVTDVPFRSGVFDLVDVFDVNESLPDDMPAFKEYFRVLRPGGFLYISEVAFESLRGEHDLAIGIVRRYTRRDLAGRLQAAGFDVLRTTYANTILSPPIFLLRCLRRLFSPVAQREGAQSDFDRAPAFLHPFFRSMLFIEAFLLKFVNLPFGVTAIAVARKPVV